jgi:MFS family permease
MVAHLASPPLVVTFSVGFAVLFALVATFTYVNFHLAAPPFGLSSAALGSIFFVYLLGVVATPVTGAWIRRFGRRRVVGMAVAGAASGLVLTLAPSLAAVIAGLGLLVTGIFVCQTAATGFLSSVAERGRASAAGLYVTCYYLGGSFGAVLPGPLWREFGWPGCVALVIAVLGLIAAIVHRGWVEGA